MPDHVDQTGGRVQLGVDLLAGPPEIPRRRQPNVGSGDHGDRSVLAAALHAVERIHAAPPPVSAECPQPDVPGLAGAAPSDG